MAQLTTTIKRDRSFCRADSAVFFDAYFFESVLQILMIVTMMLITVTTILTRVIAISITKFALFQISHSHPSKRLRVLRLHLAKSQPPTENRWHKKLYRTYDPHAMIVFPCTFVKRYSKSGLLFYTNANSSKA